MQTRRHKQIKKAIQNMIISGKYTFCFNMKDTAHRIEQINILYNNMKIRNNMD